MKLKQLYINKSEKIFVINMRKCTNEKHWRIQEASYIIWRLTVEEKVWMRLSQLKFLFKFSSWMKWGDLIIL